MRLDSEILDVVFTNKGNTLSKLSKKYDVILVFLRHFGCPFCREALDDLALLRDQFRHKNVRLIFVHLSEEMYGDIYLAEHGLENEEHISDPDMSLYDYFGLQKGSFRELYGLKVWSRVVQVSHHPRVGRNSGNWNQMPGIFVIRNNQVMNSFIHETAADRPDYLALINYHQQHVSTQT